MRLFQRVALGAALVFVSFVPRASTSAVHAGTALRMELADLADNCDLSVEARVTSVRTTRDARGGLRTEYTLRVARTLWGEHRAERIVSLPGGVLEDGSGMCIAGVPRLAIGEDALLFLTPENAQGTRITLGLAQGRLRVVQGRDGVRRLARDTSGVELVERNGRAALPQPNLLEYDAALTRLEARFAERRVRTERRR